MTDSPDPVAKDTDRRRLMHGGPFLDLMTRLGLGGRVRAHSCLRSCVGSSRFFSSS